MEDISNKDLRSYGLMAFPLAVAGLPLYLHAPDFYVTEMGVNLSIIGIILLAVRVFDAVQDPVIGVISDSYPNARRIIMMAALIGLSAGMICLFIPIKSLATAWFAFWVVIATTCFSILTINLNTLGGIWSKDTHEKTVIASSRERYGLLGVLMGVMVPGLMVIWFSKSVSFAAFAVLLAIIFFYCGWRFWNWSSDHNKLFKKLSGKTRPGFGIRFPQEPASRRLIFLTFPSAVASSLPAVLFLFFVRDVLVEESIVWVFLLIYFISAMSGIPVWRNLSGKIGKVSTWAVSIGMAIVSFIAAAFVAEGSIVLYSLVCLFTGFALGGDLVFPTSLLADYVDSDNDSRSTAGAGYAWLSFVQKAGLGLAAGIAFPLLDFAGFETGSDNTTSALILLSALYAVAPLFLKAVSLWMLWYWRDILEPKKNYEKEMDNNLYRTADAGSDTNWM